MIEKVSLRVFSFDRVALLEKALDDVFTFTSCFNNAWVCERPSMFRCRRSTVTRCHSIVTVWRWPTQETSNCQFLRSMVVQSDHGQLDANFPINTSFNRQVRAIHVCDGLRRTSRVREDLSQRNKVVSPCNPVHSHIYTSYLSRWF